MEQEIKVVSADEIQIITPQPTPDPVVESVKKSDINSQIDTLIQEKDNLCKWHECAMADKEKQISDLRDKLAIFDQENIKAQIDAITTTTDTPTSDTNETPAP